MNIKNLSNVEILYNGNLTNKILFEVPHTPYHILFTYVKKVDAWNIHVLELMTTKRAMVASGVSTKSASELITKLLLRKDLALLRKTIKIRDFAKELSKELSEKLIKTNRKTYEGIQ